MEEPPPNGSLPLDLSEFPMLPMSAKSTDAADPAYLSVKASYTQPHSPPPITLPPPSTQSMSVSPQSPPSIWLDLFTHTKANRKPFPAPTISSDGIPIVKAPPSVLLKSSETWKEYLLCHFFGEPPSHRKIFADLNPIWGKKGAIQIKPYSIRSSLILVPHLPTRDWILDIGFWSAGTVAFSVKMWSLASSLSDQPLSSTPVWLSLHNIPPPLWPLDGFELIASGVGNPLPSSSASAPPVGVEAPRIRVVVALDKGPLPSTVLVEDDQGFQVPIETRYLNLPLICLICAAYGHRSHRCSKRTSPSPLAQVTDLPAIVASVPPSVPATESSPPSPSTIVKRPARSTALPPPSPSVQSVVI